MSTAVRLTVEALIAVLAGEPDGVVRERRLAVALAEHGPDDLLTALRDAAERLRQVDTPASLRLAECVVTGAALAGRSDHQALGAMARADALWLLGQYSEAAATYEAARQVFADLQHEVGWARTHIGWVIVSYYLGRGAAALDALAPAVAVLERREEWLRAGALDMNAGYVCWRLGRFEAALERFGRAERTFRERVPGSDLKIAWLQGNRALVLTEMGQFDQALALHARARAVFETEGDTVSVLRTDGYQAEILAARGEYTGALALHQRTLQALEQASLDVDAAWTRLSMVIAYLGLNRPAEAADLARAAIDQFERLATPTEAARARYFAALALAALDNGDEARRLLNDAAATFDAIGHTHQQAMVALQQASLALADEHWTEAREVAGLAAEQFLARGQRVPAAQAHLLQARASLECGQWAAVADAAQSALAVAEDCGVPWLAYQARYLRARVADHDGQRAVALAEYAAAMASIDRLQSQLAVELRVTFLDDKLHVYHDAIDCALAGALPGLALASLERAKSRALVDYLSGHPGASDNSLADDESRALAGDVARLRAEHAWLAGRLFGDSLGRRPEPGDSGGVAATDGDVLSAAMHDREQRIIALTEQLALRRARSGRPEPPASGAGVWTVPTLAADTVVLEYYLHEDTAHVFVIADGSVTCQLLPITTAAVRRLLQFWQLNLDATAASLAGGHSLSEPAGNARGLLTALYRALIAPVEASLAGRGRLIIVPHGPLHGVPFPALFDGRLHLIERLVVTFSPSLDVLRLDRAPVRRRGGVLVIGHSAGGRLPAALAEARLVAGLVGGRLLLESDATTASVRTWAADCCLVHIAAHGEARLDNPAFAHVVLADGHLITADVFGLDLRGAIIVLSACETGRGQVATGDEVIGLSRGFLYAGAAALVQTLWRVDDEATAALVGEFYRALVGGASTGTALRAAQCAMIGSDSRRASPFFWAAFQSVGDAGLVDSG